jgi:antitoxin (DNA-binding transcriptional repressor) of toxin-antitoxin stability system
LTYFAVSVIKIIICPDNNNVTAAGNYMKTLSISEQDASLFSALAEIEERGEIFIICRNGRPIADLIPHTRKSRRVPHPVMSAVKINYDPTETLSPDEWPEGDE